MSDREWHEHFLRVALACAQKSKDPSTKVGAIIVGPDRDLRAAGFNGFPRKIRDTPERLNNRKQKLKLVVHAEMNAILAAARVGVPLKGCTMYIAAHGDNMVWGGPPCVRCTVELIQTGIEKIISWPMKTAPSRWLSDLKQSQELLLEAGVELLARE